MSSPPKVILLDSNVYFRLARTIHPLLAKTFGETPVFSLFILSDLDDEYSSSPKLKTKFEWFRESQYCEDRKVKRFSCKGKWKKRVEDAFSYLANYTRDKTINLSPEDIKALAVGFVREIPVVSDDIGMQDVAAEHKIECWSVMQLLKIMVDAGRIDMTIVKQLLEYLDQEDDLPMPKSKLRVEFKKYFTKDCPI